MELEKQKENSARSEDPTDAKQGKESAFQEGCFDQHQSDDTSPEEPADKVADFQQQLEQALEEAAGYKDRYVRTVAEMENMRKRHDKERSDLLKYGSEKVMTELLPVLDSFENAVHSDRNHTSLDSLIEGVKMVQKQLMDVLAKHGLEAFDSAGQVFDPNHHQAIQRIEADVIEDTVQDEFQKGYRLNDRLIRPAIVSVAVPGSDPDKDS